MSLEVRNNKIINIEAWHRKTPLKLPWTTISSPQTDQDGLLVVAQEDFNFLA